MPVWVLVAAVAHVCLDDLLELRLDEQVLEQPVDRRGEARDRGCGEQTAGPQHAVRLGQRARPVAGLGQVIERAELEHHVGAAVRERELARVALADLGHAGGPRLLEVQLDGIDELDVVAEPAEPHRVRARAAADVEHPGRRRRQVAL